MLEPIGRGGMGAVYAALDRELDRRVALKVLHLAQSVPESSARLLKEARILARLEHPSIVPVHDVGTLSDGRTFYAMKLVEGVRLDKAATPDASLSDLLRIFGRICEAVAFAHAHGVIHRDLKPQNIMVGPFGEALVMDWGVAKIVGDSTSPAAVEASDAAASATVGVSKSLDATAQGTVMGTPGFMAPEQARGESDRVDERADVHALGAILRFLVGRSDGSGVASVPRRLRAIWTKAMADTVDDRYQSVRDLSLDVSRFLDGLPVDAYPEGPIERARRFARRYRTPILLVLAYLVMRLLLLWLAGV